MTQSEANSFVAEGRLRLTNLNNAIRSLGEWASAFEARGGGAAFGDDATQIVYINNAEQELLTPDRRATIARLRTDV